MKAKIYFVAVAAVCIFLAVALSGLLNFQLPNQDGENANCTRNSDCDWVITNCCKETAGGLWGCINLKTFEPPECDANVICPQMFSPRPTTGCICKEGSCVTE